ncbi:MAG: HAD family hydrolase [Candidatus Hydrogenedentota bacterium]
MTPQFHSHRERPIRAVLFDFGGTLDADGVPWKDRTARLIRDEGETADGEEFDRAFYRSDDALVGRIPRTLSFHETIRALFRNLGEACHWRDPSLAERLAARFHHDSIAHLNRNAALLDQLADRYRLGVISNFYGNLDTVCRESAIGERFAVAIDSTVVNLEKPDPAIFHLALEQMHIAPQEAVFVGDSLRRDMAGARAAGIEHIWLAADPTADAACCPGDRVIHRIDDLAGLLL